MNVVAAIHAVTAKGAAVALSTMSLCKQADEVQKAAMPLRVAFLALHILALCHASPFPHMNLQ